jgi:hypothetical protein
MLSGGWFNFTRQYLGERRKSSIRFVLVAVPVAFFMCSPSISERLNPKQMRQSETIGP